MRILFVTRTNPIPLSAGNQHRTDQTIRALLALGHTLHIVLLGRHGPREPLLRSLSERYADCTFKLINQKSGRHLIHIGKWKAGLRQKVIETADRLTFQNWMITNHHECPRALRHHIKREISTGRYDVYFSNYMKMTPLSGLRYGGLKVCDTHDIQSDRIDNDLAREESNALRRTIRSILYRWSERKAARNFDVLLGISRSDVSALENMSPKSRVFFAPATFTTREAEMEKPGHPSAEIGFIGTNSKPNIDGLLWFLERVLPLIHNKGIKARINVFGKVGASDLVRSLTALSRDVELKGHIDDISAAYASAKVWIAPMRYGTGMKIKAAEALSMGAPIVGTSIAFASIDVVHRQSAMIADDAEGFADCIAELLTCEHLRSNIGFSGLEVFKTRHSFSSHCQIVEAALRAVT